MVGLVVFRCTYMVADLFVWIRVYSPGRARTHVQAQALA